MGYLDLGFQIKLGTTSWAEGPVLCCTVLCSMFYKLYLQHRAQWLERDFEFLIKRVQIEQFPVLPLIISRPMGKLLGDRCSIAMRKMKKRIGTMTQPCLAADFTERGLC